MGAGHERRGGEQDGRSNAAVPGQGGGGRSYQNTTGVLQSGKSVRLLMKGGGNSDQSPTGVIQSGKSVRLLMEGGGTSDQSTTGVLAIKSCRYSINISSF